MPPARQRALEFRPARHERAAFTLLEVLLVLALIGLLCGILITGANRLLNPGPENATQAFWHAANAARRYALQHAVEVRLSYDDSNGELQCHAMDGADLPVIKPPIGTGYTFLPGLIPPTVATNGTNNLIASLYGSALSANDAAVSYVSFYPDGTASLFRVEVTNGQNSTEGNTQTIQVDPWTVAPMLVPQNPGT